MSKQKPTRNLLRPAGSKPAPTKSISHRAETKVRDALDFIVLHKGTAEYLRKGLARKLWTATNGDNIAERSHAFGELTLDLEQMGDLLSRISNNAVDICNATGILLSPRVSK